LTPRSIAAINELPESQKREIYSRFIPPQLLDQFEISPSLEDERLKHLSNRWDTPYSSSSRFSITTQ